MSNCVASGGAPRGPPPAEPVGGPREIDARRQQRTFGDGFVADAVPDWQEAWIPHADAILDDDQMVSAVYEALGNRHPQSRTRGRRGAPAELVLRLLVLKHVRNWSYATLEREVRTNLVYRAFTHVGGGPTPDAKTMGRWGVAVAARSIRCQPDPRSRAAAYFA